MLPLVPIVIGLGAVAVGAVPALRARSRRHETDAARARARATCHRLGFGVETVAGAGHPQASEELRRAEERWHTAGALLARANTTEECTVAGQVATEGLAHLERACRLLGVDIPEVRP
ncbi:hypothetical protein [Actinophytocola sp.]|uniref:hypothetical protein n=1 Tax=Actinophytocola sp. TaxID=1872138 RepID=UPI003D6A6956